MRGPMPVVEHEVRGQRPVRARQRGLIGARDGALRVREALDLGAVGGPEQEARGVDVEPTDRAQLGVERRVAQQRVRGRVARVAQRGHAAESAC